MANICELQRKFSKLYGLRSTDFDIDDDDADDDADADEDNSSVLLSSEVLSLLLISSMASEPLQLLQLLLLLDFKCLISNLSRARISLAWRVVSMTIVAQYMKSMLANEPTSKNSM